jgi:heptosyltransferase-3
MEPSSSNTPGGILYLRFNTLFEVAATKKHVDALPTIFRGRPIYTLIAPKSEAREQILTDIRFDKILDYPEDGKQDQRTFSGLRDYVARFDITTIIVACGFADHSHYGKTLLFSLLLPGEHYIFEPNLKLVSYTRPRAWWVIIRSLFGISFKPFIQIGQAMSDLAAKIALSTIKYRTLDEIQLAEIKSIVWIRLDHIGDLVMSLPALIAIRKQFPKAKLTVLTQSSNLPILENVEGIDSILTYDAPRHRAKSETANTSRYALKIASQLRASGCDLAIDTRGDDPARKIAFACGAKYRVSQFPSVYDVTPPTINAALANYPTQLKKSGHATDNNLEILRQVGIKVDHPGATISVTDANLACMREKLQSMGIAMPYAAVHASSRDLLRTWNPDRMANVIDHLVAKHGLTVLVTGGPGDQEDNDEILKMCRQADKVVNVAGCFKLSEMPALLGGARFMLTIDTGPMHIAAAMNIPLVGLFRPRNAHIHYPYGQKDRIIICDEPDVEDNTCLPLSRITTDEVIQLVDQVLAESSKGFHNDT